jgi:hypothetical protein
MEQVAGSRETTAPATLSGADPAAPDPAADKPQPHGNESTSHATTKAAKGGKRTSGEQGTRVPEDFRITPEMDKWGREHCPHITDPEKATAEFVDYWRGVPGAKGKKLNWVATWRNRMRELEERALNRPPANRPAVPSQRPSTTTRIVNQGVDLVRKMAEEDGVDLGTLINVDFARRRELTA